MRNTLCLKIREFTGKVSQINHQVKVKYSESGQRIKLNISGPGQIKLKLLSSRINETPGVCRLVTELQWFLVTFFVILPENINSSPKMKKNAENSFVSSFRKISIEI